MISTNPGLDEPGYRPAEILALQRQAYERLGPLTLEQRLYTLTSIDRMVRVHKDSIASAISEDFRGRPYQETMLAEIVPVLGAVRHARRHLRQWVRPQSRKVDLWFRPGRAWVEWQALGCVAIISPWNYPLLLTLTPLVDALAAGNRAIVKPSELTPRFSTLLADLLGRALDPSLVAVLTGGPNTARAICRLPLDHLFFTGSETIGRQVAQLAAERLTPVTLELGGKSPALLCRDYDMLTAARTVALGKFFSAGQTCIAPDYALVPREHVMKFAEATLAQAARAYPNFANNGDYASVISDKHADRLNAIVQDARERGATVIGETTSGQTRRIGPTIIVEPPTDSEVLAKEIFGPILPVIGYDDVEQALRFIQQRPRPLAFYPFTNDKTALRTILSAVVCGGVAVNTVMMQCLQPDLPFGGVGASGIGAYHGRTGFERFSHARAVYHAGRFRGTEFLAPPYGRRIAIALRAMLTR